MQKSVDFIYLICYITYALREKALYSLEKSVKKLKKLLTKHRINDILVLRDAGKATQK